VKKVLSTNALKVIAITAMTIDHIAWMVFPGYPRDFLPLVLHIIGRITCPIMCFFVAEGYHHTKNLDKYTLRMFFFAFLSHFAYVFASAEFRDWRSFIPFYFGEILDQTSVMWSLAWGLVMLRVVNSDRIRRNGMKTCLILLICLISFPSDWSCVAALTIMAMGTNRGNRKAQMGWMAFYVAIYAAVYCIAIDIVYGVLQLGVVLSIPILGLYSGKKGGSKRLNRVMKWFFYLYYPGHLLVLGWLQAI